MSRFGTSYQVARPTGICAATGRPLEPGDVCIATLCERPDDDGLERLDYSVESWEAGTRPDRLFSNWRTTVPAPDERRNILVDDTVLLDIFHRLDGDERPQRVAFRFVLALILMRKRMLRFQGRVGRGDQERWLLRPRLADGDQEPLQVANPHLSEDDLRELTDQLSEILQSEL
jgi:hypothetical protein